MSLPAQVFNTSDLLLQFLLQSDYQTVLNLCQTNTLASQICHQGIFWLQKAEHDFGISPQEFQNTTLSPYQRYLQLYTQHEGVVIGSEQFISWNEFVRRAIRQDKNDLVQYAFDHGFQNYLIAASGALRGRYIQLFDDIMKVTPEDWKRNKGFWHKLFEAAIESGDKNLFSHVIKVYNKFDTYSSMSALYSSLSWDNLLGTALKIGNLDIFNYLLPLAQNSYNFNYDRNMTWNTIASEALKSGKRELFDYVRSIAPPTVIWFWNMLVDGAIASGNLELFNYIQSIAPANWNWDWNLLASAAGNKGMFNYIRGLAPANWDWNILAAGTLESGNRQLFDYIRSLVPPNYNWNWPNLLYRALHTGDKDLINYIMSLAPTGVNWNIEDLENEAYNSGDKELIDFVRTLADQ